MKKSLYSSLMLVNTITQPVCYVTQLVLLSTSVFVLISCAGRAPQFTYIFKTGPLKCITTDCSSPDRMRLGGQIPGGGGGVLDFEARWISKAILPILLKPCTITPQANLELEATHGMG